MKGNPREHILTEVKKITEDHLQPYNVTVYLFGSWVRHEEKRSSDIDIAVDYTQPLPQGLLSQLRSRYDESNIPYRVELVDLTKCGQSFVEKVKKEGKQWIG